MDGKIIGIDDNFFDQGDAFDVGGQSMMLDYEDVGTPPLHSMCRCCVIADVD